MKKALNRTRLAMPMTISNHKTLQTIFNVCRKNLPSVALDLRDMVPKIFESTSRRQRYHVLVSKTKAAKIGNTSQ
jgi:hypothetical protein